jgi:hypothetical protein
VVFFFLKFLYTNCFRNASSFWKYLYYVLIIKINGVYFAKLTKIAIVVKWESTRAPKIYSKVME